MPTVNTVLGPVEAADLGFTLSHEHVGTNAAGLRHTYPEFLDRGNDDTDLGYLLGLLSKGVWLGMDRHPGGRVPGTPDWEQRTAIVKHLMDAGYTHRSGEGVFAEDRVIQLNAQAWLVRWRCHAAVRKDLDRLLDELVP